MESLTIPTENPQPENDGTGKLLAILIFGWLTVGGTLIQAGGWLVAQVALAMGFALPALGELWLALAFAGAMLLPPLLLWRWGKRRYRAIFRLWATTAVYALLLAPTRLAPPNAAPLANTLQIGLTLLFGLLLSRWLHRQQPRPATGSAALGVLLAAIGTVGWVIWGALGSPLDTLLNLLAALLFGWVAGLLLHQLLGELAATSNSSGWNMALGGWAMGAALLVMAGNFGFNGLQLVQMLLLPAAGWLVVGLARWQTAVFANRRAPTLFLTLLIALPALFVDPDELSLLLNLGSRDIASWAFYATLLSLLASWLLGGLLFVRRERLAQEQNGKQMWGTAVAAWAGVAFLFGLVGQPGLHGDRLFVILRDQVTMDGWAQIADPTERRRVAYDEMVQHANSTQAELRAALARFGIGYTPYYLVNGLEVDGGPLLALWLESRPEVDRVIDSPVLRPLPLPADPVQGNAAAPATPQWNLTNIGADRVWSELGVRGEGIIIGHSDSGAEWTHPELAPTYRGRGGDHNFNWFDPWNHTTAPADTGGHGTHTLGSIVGQSVGVAPAAEWISCANLDRNLGNPALYLDCLQFMLAPFALDGDPFAAEPTRGANVLNNSWGCPPLEGCDALSLETAVNALRAAGIFVVASAGNDGEGGCETVADPIALYDSAFSVGAADERGAVASFSSRGPVTADGSGRLKPDILAPGVNVLSAFPGGSYAYNDGTSMAGPHIAGVIALIWSANPALIGQIDATEQLVMATAQPYDTTRLGVPDCADSGAIPNNAVGYGLVDAFAAVQQALR